MSKLSILAEIWDLLKHRKKWWLAPIIFFLIILGMLLVFAQTSAVSPFLYMLF